MHVYQAKSSRFESTDFASVMIDDVGCSRRLKCPGCDYGTLTTEGHPLWRLEYMVTWGRQFHLLVFIMFFKWINQYNKSV